MASAGSMPPPPPPPGKQPPGGPPPRSLAVGVCKRVKSHILDSILDAKPDGSGYFETCHICRGKATGRKRLKIGDMSQTALHDEPATSVSSPASPSFMKATSASIGRSGSLRAIQSPLARSGSVRGRRPGHPAAPIEISSALSSSPLSTVPSLATPTPHLLAPVSPSRARAPIPEFFRRGLHSGDSPLTAEARRDQTDISRAHRVVRREGGEPSSTPGLSELRTLAVAPFTTINPEPDSPTPITGRYDIEASYRGGHRRHCGRRSCYISGACTAVCTGLNGLGDSKSMSQTLIFASTAMIA
ncbi:hypothetical protein BDV95DRAFT_592484 [Massariosphaeria phaeospora]|uniref:Uncharacterized protein n=1 Tax=Massariosphaeria phaeospora TaxID=100035 RepID=A0A7C8MBX9_9PLEO|nr:hypothetical protein BDV95DRAFT_592484 [Massariosphaeria phaeospora]